MTTFTLDQIQQRSVGEEKTKTFTYPVFYYSFDSIGVFYPAIVSESGTGGA